jgi:cytoskeletal protein RodZ
LPQEFFTRAFVRAYAHEVGVNADDLLDNANVEEVPMDRRHSNVPVDESSSAKSLFAGVALGVMCTMFYSGYASHAPEAIGSQVALASAPAAAEPVTFAPPPCAPPAPVETPVHTARRPSAVRPTPVTHAVPANQIETSAPVVDSSPVMSDAILPTPDSDPSTTPVEF